MQVGEVDSALCARFSKPRCDALGLSSTALRVGKQRDADDDAGSDGDEEAEAASAAAAPSADQRHVDSGKQQNIRVNPRRARGKLEAAGCACFCSSCIVPTPSCRFTCASHRSWERHAHRAHEARLAEWSHGLQARA